MKHKVKALGLALLTTAVVGIFSAPTISAATFRSEEAHHTISGTGIGVDIIQTNAGLTQCKKTSFVGTGATFAEARKKVVSIYKECTAFGFVNATIDVNSCQYEFSGENSNLQIICGASPITITAFNCWVTIGSQTRSGVTYTNTGAGTTRDIDLSVNVEGLSYTQHSKSFPGCSNGSFTNGKFTSSATMQAFNTAGQQVGLWRE